MSLYFSADDNCAATSSEMVSLSTVTFKATKKSVYCVSAADNVKKNVGRPNCLICAINLVFSSCKCEGLFLTPRKTLNPSLC